MASLSARQPLHLAHAGTEQRPRDPRRRRDLGATRRPTPSTSTSSSTRSSRRRARASRACSRDSRPGTRARARTSASRSSTSAPPWRPRAADGELDARPAGVHAIRGERRPHGDARSPSAATTSPPWSNGNTPRGAIAAENVALDQALALFPATLRRAQHDLQGAAGGAQGPGRPDRRVQAGDQEPRAVPARLRRSSRSCGRRSRTSARRPQPGPDNDLDRRRCARCPRSSSSRRRTSRTRSRRSSRAST